MPDYSKAVIYTIRTGDETYVGSTTNFTKRKCRHKSDIDDSPNVKLYKTITKNGGEWDMQPYKQYPCASKMELVIEEERVRRELNASLNMCKCHRTAEENKEYASMYRKKYREKNLDKLKEKEREYREKNLDKIKEQIKQYQEKNRDKINTRRRELYDQKRQEKLGQ